MRIESSSLIVISSNGANVGGSLISKIFKLNICETDKSPSTSDALIVIVAKPL